MSNRKAKPAFRSSQELMALPESERRRLMEQFDRETPAGRLRRSKPLTTPVRARWRAAVNKGGRPKLGADGVKVISLSVEKELLKQADASAKKQGLKRAQFFSEAIRAAITKAS